MHPNYQPQSNFNLSPNIVAHQITIIFFSLPCHKPTTLHLNQTIVNLLSLLIFRQEQLDTNSHQTTIPPLLKITSNQQIYIERENKRKLKPPSFVSHFSNGNALHHRYRKIEVKKTHLIQLVKCFILVKA